MKKTELSVALDVPNRKEAERFFSELNGLPVIYKVGLELFIAEGPEWVRGLVQSGKRIFLDLKLHDIPNTVAKATLQVADLGIEFLTIHLSGGQKMMTQVKKELQKSKTPPKLLGVSVLTSFSEDEWRHLTEVLAGKSSTPADSVRRLVSCASDWKMDGIVCSAHEIETVKIQDPTLYTMVPGIRPEGVSADDQGRVVTPKEAAYRGASGIVVGRPITQADSPRKITEKILKELEDAHGTH